MINLKLRTVPMLFIYFLVAACTVNFDQPSSTMYILASSTPQQTTPQVEVINPRIFPTQTPKPSWGSIQCRDQGISIQPPDDFGFEGSIIYWDLAEQMYLALGGTPLESKPFKIGDEYSIIGFSSSGSLLAFNEYPSNSVEIFDNHGLRWQIIPDIDNLDIDHDQSTGHFLIEYVTWLDDSAFFVQLYPVGDGEQHRPFPAILDIRSGEWVDEGISSLPDRSQTSVAIPSPNLQYIAFSGLSVWSVKDTSRIWTSDSYDYSISGTKGHGILRFLLWSPTSTIFAYTSHDSAQQEYDLACTRDVYLVDVIDNKEKKITNLSDYPAIVSSLLAWSPDGRYLAFNASTGSSGHASFQLYLLIYDTYENEYAYSCQISNAEYISSLVWSPSSDSFIFYTSCNSVECPKPLMYGEVTSDIIYTLNKDIGHLGQGWSPNVPAEFGEPLCALTIRWNGPGMLRDLAAKLYDVSG